VCVIMPCGTLSTEQAAFRKHKHHAVLLSMCCSGKLPCKNLRLELPTSTAPVAAHIAAAALDKVLPDFHVLVTATVATA
jgi:hypothetical protein